MHGASSWSKKSKPVWLECRSVAPIGKKDVVSLAGLDNTYVVGKQAITGTAELAKTVIDARRNGRVQGSAQTAFGGL